MATYVRCGALFTGVEDSERKNQTLAIDDAGRLTYVGATDAAPMPGRGDSVLDYGEFFVMPGLHRCAHAPRLRQRQDRGRHRPVPSDGVPRHPWPVLRAEVRRRRLHLDLRAGRRRPDQPVGAQRDQLRPVRRAACHCGRPLPHHAPGPHRLVSDLDRRARHLHRAPGDQPRRGDRGDPGPGQERRRLHQGRPRRRPAPARRRVHRRLHPGRDKRDRHRSAPPWPQGGGARARPGGDALRGARRRRPHLPCLLPRRRVHRRAAAERQRDRTRPSRFRATLSTSLGPRAGLAQGAHRATCSANTRPPARTCAERARPASR